MCYGRQMDIAKIKEAQARLGDHSHRTAEQWREDRELLLAAVPDLLTEIERLKAIALEGWTEAHDCAKNDGDGLTMDRAKEALKEIEAAS